MMHRSKKCYYSKKRNIINVEIDLLLDLKKDLQNIQDSWPQIVFELQQVAKEMQIISNLQII